MDLRFGLFSGILIFAAVLLRYIGGITWQKRHVLGAKYYTGLMFVTAFWSFFGAFEAASTTLEASVMFSKLTYVGIVFAGPLWFLFSLEYSQRNNVLAKKLQGILLGIATLFLVLVFTNELHYTVWPTIARITPLPGVEITKYGHGLTFYANMVFQYVLIFAGAGMLLRQAMKDTEVSISDRILNITGILFPIIGNGIYVFFPEIVYYYDVTPLIFSITGVLILVSVLRYRFYQGIADIQEVVLQDLKSGIVLINYKNIIVDLNGTAVQLFEDKVKIGTPLESLPEEIRNCFACTPGNAHYFSKIGRWYEAREQYIVLHGQRKKGRLVTFIDITEAQLLKEQAEHSRQLLSTIIDSFPDVVIAIDREGKVFLWNKEAEKVTGVLAEEVMGQTNEVYSTKAYGEQRPLLLDFVLEKNPRKYANYENIKKDGDVLSTFGLYKGKEYWFVAKPLYDVNGELIGAIETGRDVTEQMQSRNELQDRVDTLMKLNDIMIKREERISQLSEELSELKRKKHAK